MFRAGETFGEYVLLAHVGDGATGTVWRAKRTDTDQVVALKLSRPDRVSAAGRAAAFEQLTRALTQVGRLEHANLATIYGTVRRSEDGVFGLASEYLGGWALGGPSGRERHGLTGLIDHVESLCETLDFLHRQGLVHGNVKPQNVMIVKATDKTKVKLLDLCWSLADLSRRTEASKAYVAPEIRAGHPATAASDQWSLASILALHPNRDELPPQVLEVVRRARADEPDQRFRSVLDFARDLKQSIARAPRPASFGAINPSQDRHDDPAPPEPIGPNDPTRRLSPPRSASRTRLALIAGIVFGVAALAIISVARGM